MKFNLKYLFAVFVLFSSLLFSQKNYLTLTSPVSDDNIFIGIETTITWTSINVKNVTIEYSKDNGNSWNLIERSVPSIPRHYTWVVPEIEENKILLRIVDSDNSSTFSLSKPINVILGTSHEFNPLSKKNSTFKVEAVPIKIMPLGNSITRGVAGSTFDVGYRRSLYKDLVDDGYSIDFVGSKIDGFLTDFDMQHEGHGGWHAQHPSNKSISIVDSVSNWLNRNPPDVILLHIGTNDIGEFEANGETVTDLVGEVSAILDSIDSFEISYGKNIKIFLAQIINRTDDGATLTVNESLATTQFNIDLLTMANNRISLGDEIVVVNMEPVLTYPGDLADGIHPNDSGYTKMANKWLSELISALGNPPTIAVHPASEGVFLGSPANFNISVAGEEPFTFQWKRNGVNISGATESSYSILSTQLIDNGAKFSCFVSNPLGSLTSKSATLFINSASTRIDGGQIVYYDFKEGIGDTIHDNSFVDSPIDLVIQNSETVEWNSSGLQINSASNISSENIANKLIEQCTYSDEITIEAWVKPANLTQSGPARIISYSPNKSNRNFSFGQENDSYQVGFRTTETSNAGNPINSGIGTASLELSQVVFTRSNYGISKLFINGIEKKVDSTNFGGQLTNWDSTYKIALANEFVDERPFEGLFYLLSIYNRQLSKNEIEHNYLISKPNLEAPSNLTAVVNNDKYIQLDWQDNSNSEVGFYVEKSISNANSFSVIDTISMNSTSFIDSIVTPGIKYFYKIKSFNEIIASNSSNIVNKIIPLSAPLNLEVFVNASDIPELSWVDSTSGENGFIIEGRASHPDSLFYVIDTLDENSENYIDLNSKYFSPYIYRVLAFSNDTISNPSNEVLISVVSVEGEEDFIPNKYKIYQNYPNPFNPTTMLKYDIPEQSNVKIIIYNVLGELISVLYDGVIQPGQHNLRINGHNLPSGIYFCTLNSESVKSNSKFSETIKLLLLK